MGKLIKRYVIEYANDYIKLIENNKSAHERITKIDRIVHQCEYGYISNMEAVKLITEVIDGKR